MDPITKRANGNIVPPSDTTKRKVGTNKPSYIYIVGEQGKQNREVSKAQYDKWTGPKISMRPNDPRLSDLASPGINSGVKRGYIPRKP